MSVSQAINPFEALAAQQLTAASKRKHKDAERRAQKSVVLSERDAPMKGTPAEEARDVRNAQMAGYRRHKAKEADDLCHGRYGREVLALVALMKATTIDDAQTLIDAILGAAWIKQADSNTRHAVLSMVADVILKLRIRNGLPPFDDAIFDEEPTAFQIVRHGLTGV